MSDTKYSVSRRSRHYLHSDRPRLSDHIVGGPAEDGPGRWDERMPHDAISPEAALDEAVERSDIAHLAEYRGNAADDVYLYFGETVSGQRYVAVFVADHETDAVVTCYSAEDIDAPPLRSFLYALGQRLGFHEEGDA